MSEISPRPWSLLGIKIYDAKTERIISVDEWRLQDLAHLIKCVNEHDALVAEVERLNKELVSEVILDRCIFNALERRAEKAEAEVEELKEVIREAMRRLKPDKEDGAKDEIR